MSVEGPSGAQKHRSGFGENARIRRRPGENRASLIAAGTHEFGLHGFAAAQTAVIAARAGVSQPNVYANFASKRDLFLACVRDLLVRAPFSLTGEAVQGEADEDLAASDNTRHQFADSKLLYQAVAAAQESALTKELLPLLAELRSNLGEQGFERAVIAGARVLLNGEPGVPN